MMQRLLGYIGGLCILICRIPQLLKIITTKKAQDVSLWMYILASLGGVLWVIYGIISKDMVIIVSNAVISIIDVAILICTIKWS